MRNGTPRIRRLVIGLAALVVAWCAALFAYGFVHFPATPYKPCGADTYCDKLGRKHSSTEFEAFSRWNRLFGLSWPLGIVSILAMRRMGGMNG